jgi:probable HAF family extracellular repeat protein
MRRWFVSIVVVAAALPVSTAAARWHLTDLGTLGGPFSRATAINSAGQVVGFSTPEGGTTREPHCFLWERGRMRDIGKLPGSAGCQPVAIDDAGDVAGNSGAHAFFWRGGLFTDLGEGEVVGMNGRGWVAVATNARSFVWHGGVRTRLPSSVEPTLIEDNGDLVVTVFLASGKRAAVWHAGKLRLLPLLAGATESFALGVNAAGAIAGTNLFTAGSGFHTKAVLWRDGAVTSIPAPNRGDAEAVSGLGEVGVLTTSGDAGVGMSAASYVWSNGKLLPLNGWVDFTCANHHLLAGQRRHAFVWMNDKLTWLPAKRSGVNGVNESDQIVGWTVVEGAKVGGTAPVHAALWSH